MYRNDSKYKSEDEKNGGSEFVWFGGALLQVKPKLPGTKTGSRRLPDVTGGMDNGFSSCAAPAFCRCPGISDRGRYMRVLRAVRQL